MNSKIVPPFKMPALKGRYWGDLMILERCPDVVARAAREYLAEQQRRFPWKGAKR